MIEVLWLDLFCLFGFGVLVGIFVWFCVTAHVCERKNRKIAELRGRLDYERMQQAIALVHERNKADERVEKTMLDAHELAEAIVRDRLGVEEE